MMNELNDARMRSLEKGIQNRIILLTNALMRVANAYPGLEFEIVEGGNLLITAREHVNDAAAMDVTIATIINLLSVDGVVASVRGYGANDAQRLYYRLALGL